MDWTSRRINALVEHALREDHAVSDSTTLLAIELPREAQAEVVAKQECVLAGLGLIPRVYETFRTLALVQQPGVHLPPVVVSSRPEVFDGMRLQPGATVAVMRGDARQLLSCERVILNFLQHLSGIATQARKFVDAVKNTGVKVLDTRKTVPGMRLLEKYAVTCGGALNHRADLSDGILIKNNHLAIAGSISAAVGRAQQGRSPDQLIEVEVRSLPELEEALASGAERILLDNMTPRQVRKAVETVGGRASIEVSGGMTLHNIRDFAVPGVQYISVGAVTHSAPAVDLSMRMRPV